MDAVCFNHEVDEDEAVCFSWAGWGGPCSWDTIGCKDNEESVVLEECINEGWEHGDEAPSIHAECFAAASDEVEELYWAYMQCIFCSACDTACATYADSKNCEDYSSDSSND